jgi:hypothetical protein
MRRCIALIILCCLVSCSHPEKKTRNGELPSDSVLSRSQMTRLLTDLHLVEGALQLERNRGANMQALSQQYYQWLFSRYHISRKRFLANLDYYKKDPETFQKIYEDVVKELTDRAKKPPITKK